MRALPWLTVAAVSSCSLLACGPSPRADIDANGTSGNDGNNNTGGDGGNNNDDGCADSAKLVYVVDEDYTLSTFDPSTKTFTDLGMLNCPDFIGTPFSMSIDRVPSAWVEYDDGQLFHVALPSLACTASSWSSELGLDEFGMGFSSDTSGGSADTLFVGGGSDTTAATSTLATLNTSTFTATKVGTLTGQPELTGNDNAELWGFFPDKTTPRVENINKTNGSPIVSYPLTSLAGTPEAWAFAFWGGDYWIFLEKGSETSTTVYQINGATGAVSGHTAASGRTIVGAGVSTCAPVIISSIHQ